jgi:hypothetical protein
VEAFNCAAWVLKGSASMKVPLGSTTL